MTIGPVRPHALDIEILFWEVDRLCLHPQAMSVYYQKGITCLTAKLDLTRDSRGLGQVQIIIWAIMFSLLCHISSHLLTFGIVTKCLNWHVRVPEKFNWMQNEFGQRTPNISGTVTWLLPGELTLDVDIWGVQIIIGWRNIWQWDHFDNQSQIEHLTTKWTRDSGGQGLNPSLACQVWSHSFYIVL